MSEGWYRYRHAHIRISDGVFYLEDKSTNGVFVNQQRERLVRGRPHALHSGGTIFIDDINSASGNLQLKLLRVLQEKVIERVEGNTLIPVDVRIICATNTSLQEEVARQNFREDLYYRVNVESLAIPPLRERLSDISPLAEHFIKQFNLVHRRKVKGVSKTPLQVFLRYRWPGNVREFENVIVQAVILSHGDYLIPERLS